ncbi:unnamed protein product, partial [marine sediment metagenome]
KQIQGRKRESERLRESLALRATAMGMHMSGIPRFPNEITMESMDRYRDEMKGYSDKIRVEFERQRNKHFQEITRNLRKRDGYISLVCPKCGEDDHGNRMNGKPYCFMNTKHGGLGPVPLMTPEKAKDWKPPTKKFKKKDSWELDTSDIVRERK